jgi:chromosome segregation ATPase
MLNAPINSRQQETSEWTAIHQRLDDILSFLQKELAARQSVIDTQEKQIARLQLQLQECRQISEGSSQLINKLLNDLENYRKDIEWYRRTYEQRSLPGTVWQKLFHRHSR